jgi:RHS repeat-associated protein
VQTAGATSFTYDSNGNELTAASLRTSTYNAKDQLDSLTPQGQAAIPMTYTGAGQFRRVTRGSTSFTSSALGLTREDATSYTVSPDGFVLGQRSPSRLYFLHDGLGSVIATANEGGSESSIARYDAFGGCLANCPTVPYGWLGGLGVYFDAATGLYKMGTRYYDPALGRFTQVDPIEGGSANRYDYADQDPINGYDLDGLATGGIYVLWNSEGVRYVGRSFVNVHRRSKVSLRDLERRTGLNLNRLVVYEGNNRNVLRGLEQRYMNRFRPDLNRIRAVGRRNPNRAATLRAARGFGPLTSVNAGGAAGIGVGLGGGRNLTR